jgi:predicted kinase
MEMLKELMQNKPILYIPIGASGSGKSTYLRKLREENPDILSFSWDDLRMEWYDPDNYGNAFRLSTEDKDFITKSQQVFRNMVKTGKDIYVDNTNLTAKRRKFYIDIAKRAGYRTVGIEMPVDVETIVARQKTRGDKNVKETAVRDQHAKLQPPRPGEFDENRVSYHNISDK